MLENGKILDVSYHDIVTIWCYYALCFLGLCKGSSTYEYFYFNYVYFFKINFAHNSTTYYLSLNILILFSKLCIFLQKYFKHIFN